MLSSAGWNKRLLEIINSFVAIKSYMRKIKADVIYSLVKAPQKDGILVLDEQGVILDLLDKNHPKYAAAAENAEVYSGIICPGFVNTHCHLELSYLHAKIDENTGLSGFVSQLQKTRTKFGDKEIEEAIVLAENQMIENGIVAVGDICNGTSTLKQKLQRKLYYHSFIELFAFDENKAEEVFDRGKLIYESFIREGLSASITPHAPYSTSEKLMRLIAAHSIAQHNILSIHNQESEEENKLFQNKSGKMAEMLQNFGFDLNRWKESNQNSLPTYSSYLNTSLPILLVHNTYTSAADLQQLDLKNFYLCICANANLFIENKLPPLQEFTKLNARLTLGTDSLASNHQLSVWEEIKSIRTHFPTYELNELLKWACLNGANYLGIQQNFGSFEVGKKPGINWIEFPDSPQSKVKKLQ